MKTMGLLGGMSWESTVEYYRLLICTNTMHKLADEVQAGIGIPLLHIADATAAAVRRTGVQRVGLLGTRFTMEDAFYREHALAAVELALKP